MGRNMIVIVILRFNLALSLVRNFKFVSLASGVDWHSTVSIRVRGDRKLRLGRPDKGRASRRVERSQEFGLALVPPDKRDF